MTANSSVRMLSHCCCCCCCCWVRVLSPLALLREVPSPTLRRLLDDLRAGMDPMACFLARRTSSALRKGILHHGRMVR